jgi:capsular exopolysaccharide synthesis family protein
METQEYLQALRKHWRWVAVALAVALALAGTLNVTMPRRYASIVTFFVNVPSSGASDAYDGSLFSAERVKSYVEVLTSDRLARSIAADGKLGLDVAQVRSRITARPVPDSVLLQATVTDTSPDRSLKIASSLSTQFVALVRSIEAGPGGRPPAVSVEVVVGPELNPTPLSPRPLQNLLLAGLLGLLIGAAVAVLKGRLDTSVRSPDALQRFDVGPYLGSISADRTMNRQPLVGGVSGLSWRAEELRRLRTNLTSVKIDGTVRTIAITSAVPGEGRSSVAANLAILFAQTGFRVVVVDANLRNPRLADIFHIEAVGGLTNVLAGQASLDSVLQPWGARRLCVLPSGTSPPNPSELLGSPAMAALLRELRDTFDLVIIDTPPLLPVTDAAVVAAQADGNILVVRNGRTSVGQVRTAAQALHTVEARMLGCVLNMAPALSRSQRKDYRSSYRDERPRTYAAPAQPSKRAGRVEQVVGPVDIHRGVAAGVSGGAGPRRQAGDEDAAVEHSADVTPPPG